MALTTCIIHCLRKLTYENPHGFSIQFVFAKISCLNTQRNHTQKRWATLCEK
jgi:hypothetical protein